jgi:hypothetical protein
MLEALRAENSSIKSLVTVEDRRPSSLSQLSKYFAASNETVNGGKTHAVTRASVDTWT